MTRKTWNDIREAARTRPVLAQLVTAVENNPFLSREDALILAVLELDKIANSYREQTEYALLHQRVVYIACDGDCRVHH